MLIALGAEQVVEIVHTQRESDGSLRAVRLQLSQAAGVYDERVQYQPCLESRLKTLDGVVRRARQTGTLPDIGEIGRAPVRPVPASAWASASEKGLTMQFPDGERDLLSLHYAQSAEYPRAVENEDEMWSTLGMLEHAPGPIDGAMLAAATTTLDRLKFRDWLNGINAAQQLETTRQLGITPDYFIVTNQGEEPGRAGMMKRVRSRSVCKPLLLDGEAKNGST